MRLQTSRRPRPKSQFAQTAVLFNTTSGFQPHRKNFKEFTTTSRLTSLPLCLNRSYPGKTSNPNLQRKILPHIWPTAALTVSCKQSVSLSALFPFLVGRGAEASSTLEKQKQSVKCFKYHRKLFTSHIQQKKGKRQRLGQELGTKHDSSKADPVL